MFNKKIASLFVRPAAHFVPSREAALDSILAVPAFAHASKRADAVLHPSRTAVWTPASSRRIRIVEGAVVVALMAYFASGLLATFGIV